MNERLPRLMIQSVSCEDTDMILNWLAEVDEPNVHYWAGPVKTRTFLGEPARTYILAFAPKSEEDQHRAFLAGDLGELFADLTSGRHDKAVLYCDTETIEMLVIVITFRNIGAFYTLGGKKGAATKRMLRNVVDKMISSLEETTGLIFVDKSPK